MNTKQIVLRTAILLLALIVMEFMVQKAHTVTLASGESTSLGNRNGKRRL